jgi:serine/threonine-protein kinase
MELINGGSVRDFYKSKRKQKKIVTELEASQIMMGLIKAVEYLHKKDIIHRDIKPGKLTSKCVRLKIIY